MLDIDLLDAIPDVRCFYMFDSLCFIKVPRGAPGITILHASEDDL